MTMRKSFAPAALLALLALTACQTAREGLGMYQRAADKGFEVSVGDAPTEAAATDDNGQPLPGGMVGDTVNRKYTTPPATPQ